ncbi:uncharacterized protein A4U43_C01F13050 [Asparagus officinalis]|uniref:Uncharacterized protein n=1 Tax=Asparagus officinalis TaxID=4686 RepID=A0A5P1FPJ0_ASPOF|nr:uncharacterized protein A4U43_C01F13050 [Asparagus officinalis]
MIAHVDIGQVKQEGRGGTTGALPHQRYHPGRAGAVKSPSAVLSHRGGSFALGTPGGRAVASAWWGTVRLYTDQTGANITRIVRMGEEKNDRGYSYGRRLTRMRVQDIIRDAVTARTRPLPVNPRGGMYLVLTAEDVHMEDFCEGTQCRTPGSETPRSQRTKRSARGLDAISASSWAITLTMPSTPGSRVGVFREGGALPGYVGDGERVRAETLALSGGVSDPGVRHCVPYYGGECEVVESAHLRRSVLDSGIELNNSGKG